MSFEDVSVVMYRMREPLKSSPGSKIVRYVLRIWPEVTEMTCFGVFSIGIYRGSRAIEIMEETPELCFIAHKEGQKCLKPLVLRTSKFNEPEVTGLLNQPGTPKLPIKLAKMFESTSFGDGQTAVNQR